MAKVAKAVIGGVLVGLSFVPGLQPFASAFMKLGYGSTAVRNRNGETWCTNARRLVRE